MTLTVVMQIVTFVIVLYILYRLTWRPVGTIMRERSRRIETNLQTAEENISRAQQTQQETERQLVQARAESGNIVAAANRAAEAQRQTLIEQARRDAEGVVRRAGEAIGRERQAAVDELRREAARAAVYAAGRVLDRSLDADTNRALADQTIAEVGSGYAGPAGQGGR